LSRQSSNLFDYGIKGVIIFIRDGLDGDIGRAHDEEDPGRGTVMSFRIKRIANNTCSHTHHNRRCYSFVAVKRKDDVVKENPWRGKRCLKDIRNTCKVFKGRIISRRVVVNNWVLSRLIIAPREETRSEVDSGFDG